MSPSLRVWPLARSSSLHHRWRFLMLIAATAWMLLQASSVLAASGKVAPTTQSTGSTVEAVALDALCVDGLVINHEEEPMRGWTVTANYLGSEGTYEALTDESNRNGEFSFELPAPGRWSFTVDVPEDWEPVTEPSFEVNVTYGSTDCLNIRFKLKQLVRIIVYKIDDNHQPLEGWIVWADPGPDNPFDQSQRAVTDENGVATFNLPPGRWTFREEAPDDVGWWRPISPPDGVQSLDVVTPGPYEIRFKNLIRGGGGCLVVNKYDVPPQGVSFGLPDWLITVERLDGSIAGEGMTDAFGRVTFRDLPFGPYIVSETMQEGWEAASPTMYEVTLTRDDEDCQVIDFYNRQVEPAFCIEGGKLDQNGMVGLPGWTITATPEDDGDIEPDPVLTDGTGRFRIDLPLDDYRVPNSTYTVCEEVPDGWTPVGPTCYTVTLPEHEGACVATPPFINRQSREDMREPVEPSAKDKMDYKKSDHQPAMGCRAEHRVSRGDTLAKIARSYGSSVQAIVRVNRIRNPNLIYAGQRFCIP